MDQNGTKVKAGNKKDTKPAKVVLVETVQGWEVWISNGDRYQCHHHTLVESTARRLARCRGYYTPVTMHVINGRPHAPIPELVNPTWDDREEERKLADRRRVLERVRDLGLSQEELDLLEWKP